MIKPTITPSDIAAYLRNLGNPYAKLQIGDDVPEEGGVATQTLVGPVAPPSAGETPTSGAGSWAADDWDSRPGGNPYASLQTSDEDVPEAALAVQDTLSKAAFQAHCRRIFRPYIPAAENGQLRPHHRDFILHNESRTPKERFRLVKLLEKYDLSHSQVQAQFNRERDPFTEEKLKQIERMLNDAD